MIGRRPGKGFRTEKTAEVEDVWKEGKMKGPYSYDKLQEVSRNKGIVYFLVGFHI
jgi:hypothetical protein